MNIDRSGATKVGAALLAITSAAVGIRSMLDNSTEFAAASAVIGAEQERMAEAIATQQLTTALESKSIRTPVVTSFTDEDMQDASFTGPTNNPSGPNIETQNFNLLIDAGNTTNGSLTNFGTALLKLGQPIEAGNVPPELLEAVRNNLKFQVSDEALERGLLRMSDLVSGLAADLGLDSISASYTVAITEGMLAYKRTEAFLEAQKAYGIRTVDDLNTLTQAQWLEIGRLVESRSTLDKMNLGTAILPTFGPYLSQLILFQNGSPPPWLPAK